MSWPVGNLGSGGQLDAHLHNTFKNILCSVDNGLTEHSSAWSFQLPMLYRRPAALHAQGPVRPFRFGAKDLDQNIDLS